MNKTIEDILTRCSVREYSNKQVSKEELDFILKAGLAAASGMNRQATKIIALQNKEDILSIGKMNAALYDYSGDPFYGAPTVLIVLAEKNCPTGVEDGSLVLGNIMLAAHSLGLGSCWIHRAKEVFGSAQGKKLLDKWQVKGEYIGIGQCIIGYPARPFAPAHPRKPNRTIIIR